MIGVAGAEMEGVYVTLLEVAWESDPQTGEHGVPFAVRLQVTPLLLESF